MTTAEIAAELGLKPKTIRKHAKALGLEPAATVVKTGRRGRPAFTGTAKAVARLRKYLA